MVLAGLYLHNLDDDELLDELEEKGFYIQDNGESVYFRADSNPTTGYDWNIRDSCSVATISSSFDAPYFADDEEVAGAGGTSYFTISG